MISLLGVVTGGNLGPFAPLAQPAIYIVWLFALVGGVAGMGAIGYAGYLHLVDGSNWGRTLMGVFGGVAGLGLAALCVTIGNSIGGALTF
jgi:hypothetical protein